MKKLSAFQEQKCKESRWDFSGLNAIFLNCTLKRSPEKSNTEGLMEIPRAIFERNNIKTETIRPVDYDIAPGIYPDMTEYGWKQDEWPKLFEKIINADILIIGTPIWLGDKSSVCTKIIERLYANSSQQNDKGQYIYYGKTGGCIVTGNEDGAKHCAMNILYSLQHIGYMIPPQSDAAWLGEAGPGPSYMDENSGGPENDFTNRTATFMSWNIMHLALILNKNNGIPAHGNLRSEWEAGCNLDYPNPEYR